MTNREKYDKVFRESLGLRSEQLDDALVYNSVRSWDSVGQMALVAALESTFDIVLETDDIVALNSYPRGMEILRKHGVEI